MCIHAELVASLDIQDVLTLD